MSATKRTPKPGDPFRLDGFLYRLRGIERLVFGRDRFAEAEAIVDQNPELKEPGVNRVGHDPNDPARLVQIRGFERGRHDDGELEARRRANPNYKLSGQCDESELEWAEPVDYLDAVKAQGLALVTGTPNLRAKKWRQAWVDAHVAEIELRLPKLTGAWMLPGRALMKAPPGALDAFERTDVPGTVAGILTSTLEG